MADNIFDKWDNNMDLDGLMKDIEDAAHGNGTSDFKEVPHGDYEVSIEKMELKSSKKGDPMVSIWFKILEGEYKGNRIFYNQVVTQGFQVHLANELLRSMESGLEVEFSTYKQYGELLMDLFEAVDEQLEFALEYSEGKKGFSNYKIVEVFEVE